MAGSPCGLCRRLIRGSVVAALCALLSPVAAAAEVETRDFSVFVDGKPSGDVHMTINKQDDGSFVMTCDTDIKVTVGIGLISKRYVYSYRGREVWKGTKLVRFDSTCNDDGKRCAVGAVPDGDKLRLTVNGEERLVPGDIWLSSYWAMPDNAKINQTLAIVDADTGSDVPAKLQFIGVEPRPVAGQNQKVNHFRLLGKTQTDLWYDTTGRLIGQEWDEQGHHTKVELNRLRR